MSTAVLYNFNDSKVACSVEMTPSQKFATDKLVTRIRELDAEAEFTIDTRIHGVVFVDVRFHLFGGLIKTSWLYDEAGILLPSDLKV